MSRNKQLYEALLSSPEPRLPILCPATPCGTLRDLSHSLRLIRLPLVGRWGQESFGNNGKPCCEQPGEAVVAKGTSPLLSPPFLVPVPLNTLWCAGCIPERSKPMNDVHSNPSPFDVAVRSNYTTAHLARLAQVANASWGRSRSASSAHGRIVWFGGENSGLDASVAVLRASSGGQAVLSALALCDKVDIYGSGLLSLGGATGDKLYPHFYDERVGLCLPVPSANATARQQIMAASNRRWFSRANWRRDRLRMEMLLHILHSLGILHWVQATRTAAPEPDTAAHDSTRLPASLKESLSRSSRTRNGVGATGGPLRVASTQEYLVANLAQVNAELFHSKPSARLRYFDLLQLSLKDSWLLQTAPRWPQGGPRQWMRFAEGGKTEALLLLARTGRFVTEYGTVALVLWPKATGKASHQHSMLNGTPGEATYRLLPFGSGESSKVVTSYGVSHNLACTIVTTRSGDDFGEGPPRSVLYAVGGQQRSADRLVETRCCPKVRIRLEEAEGWHPSHRELSPRALKLDPLRSLMWTSRQQ